MPHPDAKFRILVRMPNWLGDSVMATPALANLTRRFPDADVIVVGSPGVTQLFQNFDCLAVTPHPRTGVGPARLANAWRLGSDIRRRFGRIHLGVAFPGSMSTRLLLRGARADHRLGARRNWTDMLLTHAILSDPTAHTAEYYNQIVNGYLGADDPTGPTWLPEGEAPEFPRPTVAVNPGGAYGSARRWSPQRFAIVAAALADCYDIVIVGGPNERDIAAQIAADLAARGIQNFRNLAGETIQQLLGVLSRVSLLVTNDSGPMHIANAYGTPIVGIFGSTDHARTRPWRSDNVAIVRHDLPCSPCHQRVCPLGHHACMNEITPDEVIRAARRLVAQRTAA